MAKFKFRLEQLLNIKIQKEDLIKIKLATELKRLDIENEKLNLLVEENQKQISNYKTLLSCGTPISKIKEYNSYIFKLERKIEAQKLNINVIVKNVDKIRSELIKMSQERKMLEKLKINKLVAFEKEMLKEEQKMVDEIVSYRQNLNLVGEG